MAFPTLSKRPIDITRTGKDEAIRVSFEGGYEHRRPRYTRDTYKYTVTYDLLPSADIALLKTHWEEVGCGTLFTWQDKEGVSHSVYYDEPLSWQFFVTGWYKLDPIKLHEV